ncbi:hypothetical protein BDD14_5306 [Edaphobacter modestus]|uniref:Uncharacterized protein n=1 Tax=Edaphobacter modestus TaxID=388466 RepID=A0A4Q7Z091_9BACT|nr:hypothetical protein BDD14_5306 [Edaphobacter modestus]
MRRLRFDTVAVQKHYLLKSESVPTPPQGMAIGVASRGNCRSVFGLPGGGKKRTLFLICGELNLKDIFSYAHYNQFSSHREHAKHRGAAER